MKSSLFSKATGYAKFEDLSAILCQSIDILW